MRADPVSLALTLGFDRAEMIAGEQIVLDRAFRAACTSNACGLYGKCWMCPPDVGEIDELIARVRRYPSALLYQSVSTLEDSFDFEGMQAGGKQHAKRSIALDEALKNAGYTNYLHLSKGGCGVCDVCAKVQGQPCHFPNKALSSLEAYGVNVSATVKRTSMKYINGVNTVTYFGLVLFEEKNPCQS